MRVFLFGYPGDLGGASTEAWHTIKLWRQAGIDVCLIPTWSASQRWLEATNEIGCRTFSASPETITNIVELPGSIVVSFCNSEFLKHAATLKGIGCKLVWSNCMTWLFDAEKSFYKSHGLFDAYHFQSEFQRSQLQPKLMEFNNNNSIAALIRGAFDLSDWGFNPRPHIRGEEFIVGRAARPDADKWSSNTWPIYNRIQFAPKRALMLGMNEATHKKLGKAPPWADCLSPNALTPKEFFSKLHATLPVNGGAAENWPRAGLEAMAMGVPVVAQNQWGWKELIVHGETGYLGNNDEELAHYTAVLAYDESLRLKIASAARERLEKLANPETLKAQWLELFSTLGAS